MFFAGFFKNEITWLPAVLRSTPCVVWPLANRYLSFDIADDHWSSKTRASIAKHGCLKLSKSEQIPCKKTAAGAAADAEKNDQLRSSYEQCCAPFTRN